MCFDLDSAPPIPVIAGAAVSHDELVLEASDGNRFAAFLATPEEPAEVGIVVLERLQSVGSQISIRGHVVVRQRSARC